MTQAEQILQNIRREALLLGAAGDIRVGKTGVIGIEAAMLRVANHAIETVEGRPTKIFQSTTKQEEK